MFARVEKCIYFFIYLFRFLAAFPYQMLGSQCAISCSSGHHTLAVLVQWDRSAKCISLLMPLVTGLLCCVRSCSGTWQDPNMRWAGTIKSATLTALPRTRQVFFGINSHCSRGSHLFLQKLFSCHYSKSYLGEQKGKIVPIFHAFTRRHWSWVSTLELRRCIDTVCICESELWISVLLNMQSSSSSFLFCFSEIELQMITFE